MQSSEGITQLLVDWSQGSQQALDAYEKYLSRADATNNKLDIEKVNLRLPKLREQISRGQGAKRKKPD